MRWRVKTVVLLIVSVFLVSMIPVSTSNAKSSVKRKIIVFEENVDQVKKDKIIKKHGAVKVKDIISINAAVIEVDDDGYFDDEESVKYLEDDLVVSISGKAKDVGNSKKSKDVETPLEQPIEVIPWGVQYVGAPAMWDVTKGSGVKVAVIDTGIDIDHPDLIDNIKGGYNAIMKKGSFDDDNGHGTHVAGIIGAVDNEIGVIGVAPGVDLYAVKALDSNGDGYLSDIVESIEWCLENDIDIINMSFGIINQSEVLKVAVDNASRAGITIVAAAGNNYGGTCEYPAAYDEVIGVGAIGTDGSTMSLSAIQGVDVWAPGEAINSTYISGDYSVMEGTSMAAPHWCKMIIEKGEY